MKLKAKITISSVSIVLFAVISMLGIVLLQKTSLEREVGVEIDSLARGEAEKIAQDVYLMCRAAQESVQQMVDASLEVARNVLQHSGAVSLGEETVEWKAVNQYTKEEQTVHLPQMQVGNVWLGQNSNIQIPSPVVDDVKKLVGGTATIFQRMNAAGDMLRVSTNVEKLDGSRAVGTFIPHTNPDGSQNPVIAAVLKGETFRGRAYVVNAWYVTAYEPIWNAPRTEVIGILYVGVKQENVESLRKGIMDIQVGKTGYVYVLGGSGEEKGTYIISQGGKRDGEKILDARDAAGQPFIQSIIAKATALKNVGGSQTIPVAFESYPWKTPGEPEANMKTAAITYFAPWDWVIGASYYDADFAGSYQAVSRSVDRMIGWVMWIALIVVAVSVLGSFLLANGISRPLGKALHMIEELEKGNLDERLALDRKDEIGRLAKAMNAFADNMKYEILTAFQKLAEGNFTFKAKGMIMAPLGKTNAQLNAFMGNIQAAGNQIAAGSAQVSDASQSLAQGATESASSLEQITASMNELSAQTALNAQNATQANQLSAQAKASAEKGNAQMQAMVVAMGEINESGQNISRIIKTIDEIAFQTNLLALNAAVEAARAGQHGKGFAVVAEEVRNLAARSAKAARETAELIEGSVKRTENGTAIVGQTEAALREIVGGINKVSDLVAEIAAASNEQAQGIIQVNQGLGQIDQVTQQNNANAEESAAAAEELSGQAGELQRMLAQFTLAG
ncbi:MAG: chemotaxis protein [Desulfuromonadaceae bacterium GWC2_58_13]|nr:MAG: chemotaxis protein [Desulfuromonadaceae bacterium GWC2_58_13]